MDLAGQLSDARAQAANQLEAAVNQELAALGMTGARFEVTLTSLAEPSRRGLDAVEFRFAAHGGLARPLAKGASGGELSRVMLALEVAALAQTAASNALTLVFDEVDQGVGGAAALAVAERLARLARSHQVLAVTHLPQIAAAADHHLMVVKQGDSTTITPVEGASREKEVARMLAGVGESQAALTHAAELLSRDWVGQFTLP
jgi:DNA repair protein RecN (Recombination protein N)